MATNINTILNWFKTGLKPTQAQFWATWASFWHKDEQIPQNSISGLENSLNTKAEKSQLDGHLIDPNAHAELFDKKANSIHNHIIDDIKGLENVLNEKALRSHKHEIVDIEGLKDQLNTKLTATLATDAETQTDTNASEDNKVISRSKLFNWWQWIKSQTQTISGIWNFTNGLKVELSVDLKEPSSQKGISMVRDGLKFWFTETINSLLKTNYSSTGVSTVLMPEMHNGETKTLATLDDIISSSQDLDQTLANGSVATDKSIVLSNMGGLFETSITGVGITAMNEPNTTMAHFTADVISIRKSDISEEIDITHNQISFYKSGNSNIAIEPPTSFTGNFTQILQAKDGEIALLSDIATEPQTLAQVLANGNTADIDIQITDGFSLSTTIDKGMVGVGDAYGKFTTITPSGLSIREHMDTDRELLISSTSITHKNENSSVNYTLNWDESVSGTFNQTFQAKDGEIALLSDIPIVPSVSGTVSGIIDNIALQELGGVDKLINGVQIGRGSGATDGNVILGNGNLANNTTGLYNTALGENCLSSNTSGTQNLGMGGESLNHNTTGSYNVAVGTLTGAYLTTGDRNSLVGAASGGGPGSNFRRSVGIGYNALSASNNIGDLNIVLGYEAGAEITTGSRNILIEAVSKPTSSVSTGNDNIIINTVFNGSGITTGSGNLIIGKVTGLTPSSTNTINISDGAGNLALRKNTNGELQAPSLTNALIESGGTTSLVTKGYLTSRTVENFTTIELTTANLNTAYPNAVLGFKVNASSIIGGGFIYEKTSTGWIQYTVTKVP
jgi:hypothetical protein